MYKRIIIITLIFLFCLCSKSSSEWELKDHITIFGTTDKNVVVKWNSPTARYYQVLIRYTYESTRSDNVTYNIYDGSNLLSTYNVDQSNEEESGKWTMLGWYHKCETGELKVELIANDINKTFNADAVKVVRDVCLDSGYIIDNRAVGTSNTGTWVVDINNDNYGVDSQSGSLGTYSWFFSVVPSQVGYVYNYYLLDVERDVVRVEGTTNEHLLNIQLPKTGHYYVYVRQSRALTQEDIDNYSALSREELIDIISLGEFEVIITESMTVSDIVNEMSNSGKKGEWFSSDNMLTSRNPTGCDFKTWWVYGYPAPPGDIVIEF